MEPYGPDAKPIDRETFQSGTGIEDVEGMGLEHRYDNSGKVYTLSEIGDETGNPDLSLDQLGEHTETLTEYSSTSSPSGRLIDLDHRGGGRSRYVETDTGTQMYYKGLSEEESPGQGERGDGEPDG